MPSRSIAWSSPRLLITVATRVSWASAPRSFSDDREDRHDLVAVDLGAGGVDREAAVGVAVVGDAEVGARGATTAAFSVVEVGGAVAVVDVEPVGLGADLDDLGAGPPEHLGRDRARRAVGAVDDDLEAVEAVGQDGRGGGRRSASCPSGMVTTRPDVGAGGALPVLVEPRLDLVLDRSSAACGRPRRRT